MKRKIIAFLIGGLSLSLAACQTDDKDKKDTDTTPSNPVVYTVNEEEFNAASNLRYKNLTYKAAMTNDGEADGNIEMKFLADGSSQQIEAAGWGTSQLYYKVQPDNTVLYIRKNNETGVWYVSQIATKTGYEEGNYGDDFGAISYVDSLNGHFNDFTYNETNNTYTGVIYNEWMDVNLDYAVKFENKEIVSLVASQTYMGHTAAIVVTVESRGTTVIDFDSLNFVNPIYLANRTFTFLDADIPDYPDDEQAFINGNQASTLTFNNDGSLVMDLDYDFVAPHGEESYEGTYTFDKVEKSISCEVTLYGDPYQAIGLFTIDNDNVSGGIVNFYINETPLGNIHLTFKIA